MIPLFWPPLLFFLLLTLFHPHTTYNYISAFAFGTALPECPPLPRTSHILMAQSLTFAGLDSVVTFSWRPSKLPYLKITNPSAFHIPYPLSQLYFSPQLLSLSNLLHISLICLIYCLSLPHKIKAPREQRFLSVLFIGESSVPWRVADKFKTVY